MLGGTVPDHDAADREALVRRDRENARTQRLDDLPRGQRGSYRPVRSGYRPMRGPCQVTAAFPRAVKDALDLKNILNRGKMLAEI